MKRPARFLLVLLACSAMLLACDLVLRPRAADEQADYVRFSHGQHVPRGAPARSCAPCHSQPDTFEQVRIVGHAACASCHAIGAQPSRECLLCHTSQSPGAPPPQKARAYLFTHTAHRWLIVDAPRCTPCHDVRPGRAEATTVVSEEKCVACHRDQQVSVECQTCHVGLSRSTIPEDHSQSSFLREHNTKADASCLRCHAQSFCTDCHSRDHSPLWKRVSHGLDAVRDPRACATCHEADQCDRCHSTVTPSDHLQPDWAGVGHAMPARIQQQSCVTCHDARSECGVCHRR